MSDENKPRVYKKSEEERKKAREYMRKYKANRPEALNEKERATSRKYSVEHKDQIKVQMQKYYIKNAETIKQRQLAYYYANREKILEKRRAARAKAKEKQAEKDAELESLRKALKGTSLTDKAQEAAKQDEETPAYKGLTSPVEGIPYSMLSTELMV